MADTRGIRAGRAFVELGVSDQLTKGLARAKAQLKAFGAGLQTIGKGFMAAGGGVLGFMAGAVKAFSAGTHELLEMSQRTGVSVEALSELGFAAAQSGLDMEGLEKGLRKMQKTAGEAALGSDSANEALSRLGLTAADLIQLAPERQFELIADRLSQIKDPTLRAALAMEIFGKSGTELLPLMQDGAKGIEALRKRAQELGLTVSTETAEQAALLHDALKALWLVGKKLYTTIGAALAPVFTALAESVTRAVVSATAWIRQHQAVVITALQVAVAVVGVGAALFVAGMAITKTIGAFTALKAVVLGAGALISALGSILAGLLSPVGLVIGAIVALGAVALTRLGVFGKLVAWLGDTWKWLSDTVSDVLGDIVAALQAGDLEGAAKVAMAAIKLAWVAGTNALREAWDKIKKPFLEVWDTIIFGAQVAWAEFVAWLKTTWASTKAWLLRTWAGFASGYKSIVELMAGWFAKRMIDIQAAFDATLNVQAAYESVDQQVNQQLGEIGQQEAADVAAAEKDKTAAISAAEEQLRQRQAEIADADAKVQESRRAANAEQLAQAEAELAKAKEELAQAQAAVRNRVAGPAAPARPGEQAFDADALGNLLARKISVTGTFNPLALRGLGGDDAAQRTARATEETAKHTRRIAERGGLTFA
jgi:hypothetical protein